MLVTNALVRLVVLIVFFGSLVAQVSSVSADKPTPDLSVGQAAYQQHCARCHGVTAKGDGRDAKRLYPRPRDLTEGVFKFRSTASGTPPTDEDLFHTITNGLPGSGMPDWRHLDETLRWQLVDYIKSLSPTFQDISPQLVSLGEDPEAKHADVELGKQVYEKLGCAACHGPLGRGNGPSAATLVDNWGRPIRSQDLTIGFSYRSGSDPEAIVRRVLTGIDGTPMPSYAEAVSTEEAWQLAYYVRSLQQEPRWAVMYRVSHLDEALPDSPTDPRWERAERVDVRLRNVVDPNGELNAPQTVTMLSFQSLYNEEAIGFRISWHDPSEDRLPALSAPMNAGQAGTMPARPEESKAGGNEGQAGADPALSAVPSGTGQAGDALALVLRPTEVTGDLVSLQTWPLQDSSQLDLCVWSASRQQAHEALVDRFEPLLQETQPGVPLASQAVYEDGQWTVLLVRPLASPDPESRAARFVSRAFTPVAFAVWDGGNPGIRAVSTWVDLILQEPAVPVKTDHGLALIWIVSGLVLILALILIVKSHEAQTYGTQ